MQRCWFNWGERGLRKSALYFYKVPLGFPGGVSGKEPACQWDMFDPWVGEIPWRRAWQPNSSILAWRIPRAEKPVRLQTVAKSRMWLSTAQLASARSDFNFSVPSLFSYCSRNSLLVLLLTTLIIYICGPCQLFLSFCSGSSFLLFSMIPSNPTTSLIFLCVYAK